MPTTSDFETLTRLIVKKLSDDPSFSQRLDTEPRAAIESLGAVLPENLNIEILRDTSNTLNLVLPTEELSDAELASAAGGITVGGNFTSLFPRTVLVNTQTSSDSVLHQTTHLPSSLDPWGKTTQSQNTTYG